MPWHIPGELQWLARTTKHTQDPHKINALIMGRVTYESLPAARRPLAGRLNMVVSTTLASTPQVPTYASLTAAIAAAREHPQLESVFIFGGGSIYQEALQLLLPDEIIASEINENYACDTFIPVFPAEYELAHQELSDLGPPSIKISTYYKH